MSKITGLLAFALAALVAPMASAQQVSGLLPPITTDDLAAAVVAATPPPCSMPLPDTINGSAGVGTPCMTRPDATRPTIVQAKDVLTATDATWQVVFDRPFATSPIYVDARVYGGGGQPYLCTVTMQTALGASGKCYQLVATTLPSAATSLLGLVVSPVATAGAGLSVRVVARQ